MSDSEDSTVTYTAVSSPFEGLSDIGSSGVDGPPVMPEDPYAYVVAAFQALPLPDYVPSPEEPEQAPLSPEFVPEPVYMEFMPPEDEVFPIEEKPLPAAVSPTTDSPGYIADSNPEDLKEDPEEDHYPTDGGDDDDDDDASFNDDEDDDDDDEEEEDEEEEEEHLALADSVPPLIDRLLAIPSPPPSPLSPWSSPLPQIPSPPLPVSSPVPVSPPPLPASPTYPLGYRAAMIWLRVKTPSTSHPLPLSTPPLGTPPLLPIPLPTLSPPLLLPSTDYRAGVSEVTLPPRKRLCITLGPRYEVGKSSSAPTARPTGGFRADYGFVATLDDEIKRDPREIAGVSEVILSPRKRLCIALGSRYEVGESSFAPTDRPTGGFKADYGFFGTLDNKIRRDPERECMEDFVTTVRQDTYEIYRRLDDAQNRLLMSGRLNMLYRVRRAHAHTALLMEREARLSRKAWVQSMDASDTARSEVRALRTTVLAQQIEIAALGAADRARQAQLVETLRLMSTLQTQVTTLQGQQGPASGPTQPEIPEESGSSS
ncbi:hypothetical protein Tco_0235957 [Tanacetum coccineum]